MIRYYLIPAQRAGQSINSGIEPMYLDEIRQGNVRLIKGILPRELARVGGDRRWRRMFYILRIDADDFTAIDAVPDAVRLTRRRIINNRARLESLGIDFTGLTVNSTAKEIERRFIQWMTEEGRDFESVTGIAEDTG